MCLDCLSFLFENELGVVLRTGFRIVFWDRTRYTRMHFFCRGNSSTGCVLCTSGASSLSYLCNCSTGLKILSSSSSSKFTESFFFGGPMTPPCPWENNTGKVLHVEIDHNIKYSVQECIFNHVVYPFQMHIGTVISPGISSWRQYCYILVQYHQHIKASMFMSSVPAQCLCSFPVALLIAVLSMCHYVFTFAGNLCPVNSAGNLCPANYQ